MSTNEAMLLGKQKPVGQKDKLHCSFCGKGQDEVKRLVAGPTVFICDECILLCLDVIIEAEHEVPIGAMQFRVIQDFRDTINSLERACLKILAQEEKRRAPFNELRGELSELMEVGKRLDAIQPVESPNEAESLPKSD